MLQGLKQFNSDSAAFWLVIYAALFLSVLVLLISTLLKRREKKWNSGWFIALSGVALLWSGAVLLQILSVWMDMTVVSPWLDRCAVFGELFFPGLIYLHVRKQVSYRETFWYHLMWCLAAPTLLFALACLDPAMQAGFPPDVYAAMQPITIAVFALYFILAMLHSFLGLLMVFYQMPDHMRKPAAYMMTGVGLYAGCWVLAFLLNYAIPFDLMLVAAVVLLRIFYYAFGLVSAANVIATSRELVFESLSTLVLVMNNEGRILDWNNKQGGCAPLLYPRYQESYAHYLQRLMTDAQGRQSPHDENILTFPLDDSEVHYMISVRQLCNEKRQLGYLAEISGVTKIYSVFRALEETATIDQLTGLYNRNAYLQHIGHLITQDIFPLLVLVGDVNNLKPTNDVHGHLAGDALLVSAAQNILAYVPPNSFAARIGGDEFVVLAPNSSVQQAPAFIQGMTASFVAAHKNSGMNVGISWGYAVMESADEDYNAVFSRADQMMYAQKRQYARFRSSGLVPEESAEAVRSEGDFADPGGF